MKFVNILQEALVADSSSASLSKTPRQVFNAHYSFVKPDPCPSATLISYSKSSLSDCLDHSTITQSLNETLSGNALFPNQKSWSLAYAGHQFGQFAGQLGDGRAVSLAQVKNNADEIWEIQLKGAGLTPYSRTADGYATVASSTRELLASEAMHHLGIPTTRALTLFVCPDRKVYREKIEQGAIVARIAPSWIRFGSFELAFYRKDFELLESLANYVIKEFYPDVESGDYLSFYRRVVEKTATMIAGWQAVGFCHGVMNTDNFSILGLTIDYGPYQFMDLYNPAYICNHSDDSGLYAFDKQPLMARFNLVKLATALVPLIHKQLGEEDAILVELNKNLNMFMPRYEEEFLALMAAKLGMSELTSDMLETFLKALSLAKVDYTLFFRALCDYEDIAGLFEGLEAAGDTSSLREWLLKEYTGERDCEAMKKVNPRYTLRNSFVQRVIDEYLETGDASGINAYQEVLSRPYDDGSEEEQEMFGGLVPKKDLDLKCSCSS